MYNFSSWIRLLAPTRSRFSIFSSARRSSAHSLHSSCFACCVFSPLVDRSSFSLTRAVVEHAVVSCRVVYNRSLFVVIWDEINSRELVDEKKRSAQTDKICWRVTECASETHVLCLITHTGALVFFEGISKARNHIRREWRTEHSTPRRPISVVEGDNFP